MDGSASGQGKWLKWILLAWEIMATSSAAVAGSVVLAKDE